MLSRIIDAAGNEKVRVVFVQKQFSRTSAEAVACEIGGKVVEIDQLSEDFIRNTRTVAGALADAML